MRGYATFVSSPVLIIVLFAVLVLGVATAHAQTTCIQQQLYTVSATDDQLRIVDLDTLATIETHTVSVSGQTVSGCSGLAFEPGTGTLYILVRISGVPIPFLATYDINGDVTNIIGSTVLDFVGLSFSSSGDLYAISADDASIPSTLCTLDTTTGSPTDICNFVNGDMGEAIAFNPDDGLIYHASGTMNVIFETASDISVIPCGTTPISIAGSPLEGDRVSSLAYSSTSGMILWKQGIGSGPLYSVTTDGDAMLLGDLSFAVQGMDVLEVPVTCSDQFKRGDANNDGQVNGLVDAIFLLNYGFVVGSPAPACFDAADANDDGNVNGLVDAIFMLNYGFVAGSSPPPPPFPDCGSDPTPDAIGCDNPPCP